MNILRRGTVFSSNISRLSNCMEKTAAFRKTPSTISCRTSCSQFSNNPRLSRMTVQKDGSATISEPLSAPAQTICSAPFTNRRKSLISLPTRLVSMISTRRNADCAPDAVVIDAEPDRAASALAALLHNIEIGNVRRFLGHGQTSSSFAVCRSFSSMR